LLVPQDPGLQERPAVKGHKAPQDFRAQLVYVVPLVLEEPQARLAHKATKVQRVLVQLAQLVYKEQPVL
jgi:hypothetical protein